MSIASKVERIKWELAMDPQTPLSAAIQQANIAMRLTPTGTLPEQVDRLLVVMGIALRSDNISVGPSGAARPPPPQLAPPRPPPPQQAPPRPPPQQAMAPRPLMAARAPAPQRLPAPAPPRPQQSRGWLWDQSSKDIFLPRKGIGKEVLRRRCPRAPGRAEADA